MNGIMINNGLQMMLIALGILLGLWGCARCMAATANLSLEGRPLGLLSYPVAAGEHIYRNVNVGLNPAGYLKSFEPGDRWAGISYEEIDNSGGDDGDAECKVNTVGEVLMTITGAAQKDLARAVFATADDAWALTGHPDAFVGRISALAESNKAWVRLKSAADKPRNGEGCIELQLTGHEQFDPTGATAGSAYVNGFELKSILGLGWTSNDAEDAGIKGDLDNTAEIALLSCRTPNDCLPVDKGLSLDVDLCVTDKGDDAALDVVIGFGTALTTNSEANADHADMVQLMAFHLDGGSDNILFESDDNTTDVAPVDTGVDNDSTTDVPKHLKIIVRPNGVGEAWVDGVRKSADQVFKLLSTANVAAFINVEKTANDTTCQVIFRNLRVAAGMNKLAA